MIQPLLQNFKRDGLRKFLLLLLITDGFFIILHVLHNLPPVKSAFPLLQQQAFSIAADLSLGEAFQYIKEFWIALLLIGFSIKNRETAYLGWIFLFFFLVFDDMFAIHEGLGGLVGSKLSIPEFLSSRENLRVKDFGELLVSGAFGVFFLGLILIGYLRGSGEIKAKFSTLLILFFGIIFFGVGVDFLDRFVNNHLLQEILKLIEDGGEMVMMSFFCWYVYSFSENRNDLSEL